MRITPGTSIFALACPVSVSLLLRWPRTSATPQYIYTVYLRTSLYHTYIRMLCLRDQYVCSR